MGHTEWGKCSWRAVRLGCAHEESRRHLGAVRAGLKSTTRANQVLPRELNRSSWKSDRPQTTAREGAGIFAREGSLAKTPVRSCSADCRLVHHPDNRGAMRRGPEP
jgi:hypothetical protein